MNRGSTWNTAQSIHRLRRGPPSSTRRCAPGSITWTGNAWANSASDSTGFPSMRAEVSWWLISKPMERDRKSTRLNSSHDQISYAVFCLKKKKKTENNTASYSSYTNRNYRTTITASMKLGRKTRYVIAMQRESSSRSQYLVQNGI